MKATASSYDYDVIVVGARAAGAATAMLLARNGLRVLAVDRARYGSDTLSTHALMRTGVLQLHRWGLLDAVKASGAPPVRRVAFRYPDETVTLNLRPSDGVDALYAPRRTVLDPILVDGARDAGAEVRFGVAVENLLQDDSGRVVGIAGRDMDSGRDLELRARLVIGADGVRSFVARAAGAPMTRQAMSDSGVVYGYFRGVEAEGYEWIYGPASAAGVIPTNDGEVCVFVSCRARRFHEELQPDLANGFYRFLKDVSPGVAARVSGGEQTDRFRGFADVHGFFRQPWGAGWALVGDAGYFKDPITTHGISDAFRDAELLSRAIAGSLGDSRAEAAALSQYERLRNELSADLFEVTDRIASYRWTMTEIRQSLHEVSRAVRAEVQMILGLDALAVA